MEKEKKLTIGRSKIDDADRTRSFSKRASVLKLTVDNITCPYCHHHKKFIGNQSIKGLGINKCCRCKRRF